MKLIPYLLWFLIGVGLATLFLKSIWWTINRLLPEKERASIRIVILSTTLRWIVLLLVFGLSLTYSFWALLTTFSAFMIARYVLLFRYERTLTQKAEEAL